MVEESPAGGYEARVLGHSLFTQGETLDEVREAVKDAGRCHFEGKYRPYISRTQKRGLS